MNNESLFMPPHSYSTNELVRELYRMGQDSLNYSLAGRIEALSKEISNSVSDEAPGNWERLAHNMAEQLRICRDKMGNLISEIDEILYEHDNLST